MRTLRQQTTTKKFMTESIICQQKKTREKIWYLFDAIFDGYYYMEMLRTQNYVTEMFYFRDKPESEKF